MKLKVRYPYRDGFTGEIHRPGEIIEATKERAKALLKAAVVVEVEEPKAEEPKAEEQKTEEKPKPKTKK